MISRILLAALLGLSVIASTPVPSAAPSVDAINMTNITVAPTLENVRGLEDDDEGQNDNILPGDLGRKDKPPASCNHNNGNMFGARRPGSGLLIATRARTHAIAAAPYEGVMMRPRAVSFFRSSCCRWGWSRCTSRAASPRTSPIRS